MNGKKIQKKLYANKLWIILNYHIPTVSSTRVVLFIILSFSFFVKECGTRIYRFIVLKTDLALFFQFDKQIQIWVLYFWSVFHISLYKYVWVIVYRDSNQLNSFRWRRICADGITMLAFEFIRAFTLQLSSERWPK